MPQRFIDDGYWTRPSIEPLSFYARALYIYTWSNRACNAAGLYHITIKTMSDETGLQRGVIQETLEELQHAGKVTWFTEDSILWVVKFLSKQPGSKSEKFLKAVANCLDKIPNLEIIGKYLEYNKNFEIPYRYPIDTLSIPNPQVNTNRKTSPILSSSKEREVSKGEKEKALAELTQLYEANIGVIGSSAAEKIKDLAEHYPRDWFKPAIDECVEYNARSFAYLEQVLIRWEADGPKDSRRRPKKKKQERKIEGLESDDG